MKENSKYIVNRAYNKLLPPTMLSFSIASIAAITDIFFVSFYCGSFGFAVYSIFLPFSSIWGVIGEGYGTSGRSAEYTSELQSRDPVSSAVFCLTKN